MNLSPTYLIRLLEENGYVFKRAKGSHRLYYNPINNKTIIVPFHNGKDLKKGTFMAIMKQAGIE
ncbi:MAG: type II toxin-antitoxin system HicA family toxin [Bacteroidales bacterium]|nr:type II toxin-antitoxin system HicA family toxin [Bacteroidales bacterium]